MIQTELFPDIIDRLVVDASWQTPRYMVVSRNKKYIQISATAYRILDKVRAGDSFAAIAQAMTDESSTTVTPDQIHQAYQHLLARIQQIDGEAQTRQKNFWIRIPLLPAQKVIAVASRFTWLFHPLVALVFLSSFTLLSGYAFERGLLNKLVPQNSSVLIISYLLFLLSLMAHEFGHASACLRGDVKPSDIGFTIYLVFPAFYSDVSASWQLSRWKKVRVDTGGMYFQLCVGTLYLLLYLLAGFQAFQLAFLAVIGSCIISLNPFMRFDGYWIVSDMLGITNLSQWPSRLLLYCYNVARKRPVKALPYPLMTTCIIAIYGFIRTGFIVYFLTFMLPFLGRALLSYPYLLATTIQHIQSGPLDEHFAEIQALGSNTALLVIWSLALFSLLRSSAAKGMNVVSKTLVARKQALSGRLFALPRRRVVVSSALLSGLILLLVAGFSVYARSQNQSVNFAATYPPIDNLSCQPSEQFFVHYHAHLSVYINDLPVQIPKVGIGDGCYYWLHVHDGSGIIHIEAPTNRPVTLGNFFHLWKARFSSLKPGMPIQLEQESAWQVYVNGKLYHGDFHDIVLHPHLLITMGYNSPHMIPESSYNWNGN